MGGVLGFLGFRTIFPVHLWRSTLANLDLGLASTSASHQVMFGFLPIDLYIPGASPEIAKEKDDKMMITKLQTKGS